MERREFLKKSTVAGLGAAILTNELFSAPAVLTNSKSVMNTEKGKLIFKPYIVQTGKGPHLGSIKSLENMGPQEWDFPSWAFASDNDWDAFHSNIWVDNNGVTISDAEGKDKFGINVRWNVEGFGYIYMTADNGGEFYELPKIGNEKTFNLNFELAKSRVIANNNRLNKFSKENYLPNKEVKSFLDLSDEFFFEAQKIEADELKRGKLSQKALYYAMWGGEMLELDKAWFDISKMKYREDFFIGCDTKGYPHMDKNLFMDLFSDVFNYATITHYLPRFEKEEGKYTYLDRDEQLKELKKRGVTVEGRPIFWADECCSPQWLINKSYPDLLKYVEKHTREVVSHYGTDMYGWEIINEAHDFGNALKLVPDQMVEIAKLIAETSKDTNPKVHRLINNCCLQADYVQIINWDEFDKKFPLITPHQFIKMCYEAGVDFTITGQQLYYQYTNRDLADTIRMMERLTRYGKPVQVTEIGTTSGPSKETINNGELTLPEVPYTWHRHWDEDLQSDWLEKIYTLHYSKPWVEAINWYDFVDPYSFIKNGGVLANTKGEKKFAFEKLKHLRNIWRDAAKQ